MELNSLHNLLNGSENQTAVITHVFFTNLRIIKLAYKGILKKGKFYILHSNNSNDIASFIHFLMITQPTEKPSIPPEPVKEEKQAKEGEQKQAKQK